MKTVLLAVLLLSGCATTQYTPHFTAPATASSDEMYHPSTSKTGDTVILKLLSNTVRIGK